VTRHALKLALLIPGLAFLAWWGWSGNFAFNHGDLYRLADQERYYRLHLGAQPIGWAKREVSTDPDGGDVSVSEETILELSLGPGGLRIKTRSRTVFDSRGRLVSAEFKVPLGESTVSASASAARGRLLCRLALGSSEREASLELPSDGPVVVSGVVPWLSHQRDLPLGRPLEVELLDPVSQQFQPATLTIEDDTAQSEEIQTRKLTLRFMSAESVEWVDSGGLLVRQLNPALDAGLSLVEGEEAIEEAKAALAAEASPEAERLAAELSERFLAAGGLEGLSGLMGLH
jgi:hypothetical protein